ncbi:MAG: DUF5994 family protein [Pseudonocardiaceae bacterium]
MTSDHPTNPEHVDAHSLANRDCSARLSLKPSSSSARGAVDGAWWPRSTDPAIELAALIEEFRIIDTDYQRIDLLVIPVDTTPAIADLALTMATDGHDPHITATGNHRSAPVCLAAEAEASLGHRRWRLVPPCP